MIRRALVLAEKISEHDLIIRVGYDYQPSFKNQYKFTSSAIVDSSTWGEGAVSGSITPYGGVENGVYQLGMHLVIQKCQSIQFEFVDKAVTGASYSLSDLGLEVAVLGNTFRLPTRFQF